MPLLQFNGVYLLTGPPGELRGFDLAIGVRQKDVPVKGGGKPRVDLEWISVNGSGMGGHRIQGVPLRKGEIVEVQVTSWSGWSKAPPFIFRFEMLTHELFNQLGQAGWIRGYKSLAARLPDDAAVRNYFFQLYMPDSWEEVGP